MYFSYEGYCLQRHIVVWQGKSAINGRYFLSGRLPAHTGTIFSRPLWSAGQRDSKDVGMASQKVQGNLTWSQTVPLSDLRQQLHARTLWCGKITVSAWSIPNNCHFQLNNTGADDALLHDRQDDKAPDYIPFLHRKVLAQQHLILLHRNTDIRSHRQYSEN
jgi:hypothetical protein